MNISSLKGNNKITPLGGGGEKDILREDRF
jgi:hypothetical protein